MGIDINRLGPSAQAQVMAELKKRKKQQQCSARRNSLPCNNVQKMDSQLEREYYTCNIWPLMLTGRIVKCECQKRFELLPASEFCGMKLPAAHYTPDFVVTYDDGTVEVIETKDKVIKKLQREYIYRRRLFIEIIARPRGWRFKEVLKD